MREKIKYVVAEKTLQELIDMAEEQKNTNTYNKEYLYQCLFDRSDLDEAQTTLQREHSWQTKRTSDVYINNTEIEDKVGDLVYEEIMNGRKKDLYQTVCNKILSMKIKSIIVLEIDDGKYRDVGFLYEVEGQGKKDDADSVYSTNIKELENKMKNLKRKIRYGYNGKEENSIPEVYLEEVSIGMYHYGFIRLNEQIPKMVKKFIKTNLTYCIKKDEIIIPEEYIAKGKVGINEWRNLKSSSNKNNSMEKRMLKQIRQEKKRCAFSYMNHVMNAVTSQNWSWSIPSLAIDGRYNKQRTSKLITKILKENNKENIVEVDEKDLMKITKEYWKKILMDAYNAVDKCSTEDIK